MSASAALQICDVAPRDGLQNDVTTLAPELRGELAGRLAEAGVSRVEVASFVHSARVPQMAGAEAVVAALPPGSDAAWSGLVLNDPGYERARACGLGHINVTLPVTDSFSRRNQGKGLGAMVRETERMAARALEDGVRLTVTLAVAFGCPFEGPVAVARVTSLAERIAAARPAEIVVADTIGVAVPSHVRAIVASLAPLPVTLGCHFHDTRNTGVANAVAAVEAGVALLDASVGGIGGCPFAPGATGNVATEDLVYVLEGMGHGTGIDLDALLEVSAWLAARLDRGLPGALSRAGRFTVHG